MDCIWKRAESTPLLLQKCLVVRVEVPVWCCQDCPIFEPLIHCLLTVTHSCWHRLHLWIRVLKATRTFYKSGRTPTVPFVSLAPLTFLQMFCQCIIKYHIVIPVSRWIWPAPPANVACFDAQTNLISIPTLLEFVTVIWLWIWIFHCQAKVCAVHRE